MATKSTIEIMLKYGMYSKMEMDPIKYHGYKETIPNLEETIDEIDIELLLRPQDADRLLDHRLSLSKRLDALRIEKWNNTPGAFDE